MSWEQLRDISREAAELAQVERDGPPVACPNDGEPLVECAGGVWHCQFDGYRWPS